MMFTNPVLIVLGIMGLVVVNDPAHGGFWNNRAVNLFLGIGVVSLVSWTLWHAKLLWEYRRTK